MIPFKLISKYAVILWPGYGWLAWFFPINSKAFSTRLRLNAHFVDAHLYIIFTERSSQQHCKNLGCRCSLGARGTFLSLRAGAVGAALGGGLGGVEGAGAGLEPTVVGKGDALHGLFHLLSLLGLLSQTHLVELGTDRLPELALEAGRLGAGSRSCRRDSSCSRGSHGRSRCDWTAHGTGLLGGLPSHEKGKVGISVRSLQTLDGGIDHSLAVGWILSLSCSRRGTGTGSSTARRWGRLSGGGGVWGSSRSHCLSGLASCSRRGGSGHDLLLPPLLGNLLGQRRRYGLDLLPDLPLADHELLLLPLELAEAQDALGGGLGTEELGGGGGGGSGSSSSIREKGRSHGRWVGQTRSRGDGLLLLLLLEALLHLGGLGDGELSTGGGCLLMLEHGGRGRVGCN